MTKQKCAAGSAAAARQAIAADGYLAFIEWPVFLMNRLKQVEQHLTVTAPHDTPAEPALPGIPDLAVVSGPDNVAATSLPAVRIPQTPIMGAPSFAPILPDAIAATPAATDGAEGELMRLLDGFTMQGADA